MVNTISIIGSPPSANRYWRTKAIGKRVITYVSDEAKQFKRDMYYMARAAKVVKTLSPVSVSITWHRKTAKSTGDIDNRIKVILDSLNGIAWDDDKQVHRLFIEKKISGYDGMDVTIKTIEE